MRVKMTEYMLLMEHDAALMEDAIRETIFLMQQQQNGIVFGDAKPVATREYILDRLNGALESC